MKIRNEANRKMVAIIDSKIARSKIMKNQFTRQNSNTIKDKLMLTALNNSLQALYEVRKQVANSVFEVDFATVVQMIEAASKKDN